MRTGVKHLVEKAKELWEKGTVRKEERLLPPIFFYAPTGYGKSIAAPLLARVAREAGIADSLVHVMPSRSLVHNMYLCKYVLAVSDENEREKIKQMCGNRVAPDYFVGTVKELAESVGQVVYQAGVVLEGFKKSPTFEDFNIIVTTLDSFAYTLLKVPVPELFSHKKHYAIPFSWIYTSLVYLDEVHAYVNSEVLPVVYSTLEYCSRSAIPVVATTATPLPALLEPLLKGEDKILKTTLESALVIEPCCCEKEREHCYYDDEFEKKVLSVNWRTEFINFDKVVDTVVELVKKGKRVLVAVEAIEIAGKESGHSAQRPGTITILRSIYEKLKETGLSGRVATIHGLMTKRQQREILERLGRGLVDVLIASPVINAGVDISFDAIVALVSRPETLIQFVGRVCRDNNCGEADVYLVKDEFNRMLVETVRGLLQNESSMNWHLYCRSNAHDERMHGYTDVIERFYKNVQTKETSSKDFVERLSRQRKLLFTRFPSSKRINEILREANYALVRSHLVELLPYSICAKDGSPENRACVDIEKISSSTKDIYRYLAEISITMEFKRAVFIAKGILVVKESRCSKVERIDTRGLKNEQDIFEHYIDLAAKSFVVLLVDDSICNFDEETGLECRKVQG